MLARRRTAGMASQKRLKSTGSSDSLAFSAYDTPPAPESGNLLVQSCGRLVDGPPDARRRYS